MATGYAGNINTYIPTLDLSGNLMVSYSRNVKDFPLNSYVQITPVKLPFGAYLRFNPLDLGRLRNAPNGNKWAPGTPAPTGFHDRYGFTEQDFRCTRFAHSCDLDKLSVDVANWPVQKNHSELLAQEAMTDRAYQTCKKLNTSTNFATTHSVAASTLAGGFLDGGTTSDPRIFKALSEASAVIQQDSMGRVRQGDLFCLMNHNTARKLSRSREIREYVMQQQNSRGMISFGKDGDNGFLNRYGLPVDLYSYPVVVEDTMYNSYNRGNASEVGAPVFADNEIFVGVRQGGLESSEGAASYSTCHLFIYEDMTVEAKDDAWNRLLEMRVVDHYTPEIVAPVTGFRIINVFS